MIGIGNKLAVGSIITGIIAAGFEFPQPVYLSLFGLAVAVKTFSLMKGLVENSIKSVQVYKPLLHALGFPGKKSIQDERIGSLFLSASIVPQDFQSKVLKNEMLANPGSRDLVNSMSFDELASSEAKVSGIEKKRRAIREKYDQFESTYIDMIIDLHESGLSEDEIEYGMDTIKAIAILQQKLNLVEDQLKNGDLLKNIVLRMTRKNCHDENYFIPNTKTVSFEMFANSVLLTSDLLKGTYLKEKNNKQLLRFFSCAFGPGCFERSCEDISEYARKFETFIGELSLEIRMFQKQNKINGPVDLNQFSSFLLQKGESLEKFGINSLAPRENKLVKMLERYKLIQPDRADIFEKIDNELSVWIMNNEDFSLSGFEKHVQQNLKISKKDIKSVLNNYFQEYPDRRKLF